MTQSSRKELVYTIPNRCRVCYTCVRECPAKAIQIINGQAQVINKRCIGCGNCVKVCSQNAKAFIRLTDEVELLLASEEKVAAIVAPSFPAEFDDIGDYKKLVGMIRDLGFDLVCEVAFGADLVSNEFNKLLKNNRPYISSDCPAIVFYIEHYHPDLVKYLAPIASPMVATTRVVKEKYGNNTKVVFIGPCVAKKAESEETSQELTYIELREMFEKHNISPENSLPSEFDPPTAGKSAIFPVARGLLQTIDATEDVNDGRIIAAEGRQDFKEAIKEFENGVISQSLELLCCESCIMGPGTNKNNTNKYARRIAVNNYVKNKLANLDTKQWKKDIKQFKNINMSQSFSHADRRIDTPTEIEINSILTSIGKNSEKDHLNCGACGYVTCREHAIAIIQGFAETEMCLPYSIEKLHNSLTELKVSNEKLNSAREALKQQEKLAHMGQLSAGIAHELNNPLGIIIMYSNILLDECKKDSDLYSDLKLISEQSDRCKSIVGGLLNFARKNQIKFDQINIPELINKSLSSVIIKKNISVVTKHNLNDPLAWFDIEQMIQVISNLAKNAIEAMPNGGELTVYAYDKDDTVIFEISDTGHGIKGEYLDKVFEPFFTTKGLGKGTGLGLATIYGIVKMHNGQINVISNTNPEKGATGTKFTIKIPRKHTLEKK
ncbi:MAG: [Fe-Fe] hydrogenase large subunit C-terminal domain-containing protein [Bacteroidota bacterium]|nr:[Fe-Fe] hydrogenase large subunit C-terminal domain-containing protein [Bacteroidota bacterium]